MSSAVVESDGDSPRRGASASQATSPGMSKLWLIRMPGGPLKAVKSAKQPLSAQMAKAVYRKSFEFISTEADIDPELVWPELRPIDQMTLEQRYPFLLEISEVTKKPRGLVEC